MSENDSHEAPDALRTVFGILEAKGLPTGESEIQAWLGLFEPPFPREERHTRQTKSGAFLTVDPYADRIRYLLTKFLSLSPEMQDYIRRAREDGIFWRGDDMHIFEKICVETMEMHSDSDYRNKTFTAMRNVVANARGSRR